MLMACMGFRIYWVQGLGARSIMLRAEGMLVGDEELRASQAAL